MGLDKKKSILTRDQFEVDPFKRDNLEFAAQNRSTLPTSQDDVMLDRRQSVYYSVEYALQRLLQNDKFIDEFLSKSQNQISCAVDRGLSASMETSILSSPEQHRIYDEYYKMHEYEYHAAVSNDLNKYKKYSERNIISADKIEGKPILSYAHSTYANDDMSNFDAVSARAEFQKSSNSNLSNANNITISNDILLNYEYNDSPTVRNSNNYVNVTVCNKMTHNKFQQNIVEAVSILDTLPQLTECTYIYKEWLSGFKELYIHIPTTYTFYNSNEAGEKINENATWICVRINKRHFKFNHIYQAHICGQSLPMQIHADPTSEISCYNDVVLPSMLRTMCTSDDNYNNTNMIYDSYQAQYVLYFVCYGTDEQAIRIFGD